MKTEKADIIYEDIVRAIGNNGITGKICITNGRF